MCIVFFWFNLECIYECVFGCLLRNFNCIEGICSEWIVGYCKYMINMWKIEKSKQIQRTIP